MKAIAIVALCTLGAIVYGIVHDSVTARICIEYFTIGHPHIIEGESPTRLALVWGVIATWWVGLILGLLLALCARVGSWPKLSASDLLRPLVVMLVIVGALAIVAGLVGHTQAVHGRVWLTEPLASAVPADRHAAFLTDLWAHLASYLGGVLGGLVLCVYALVRRARTAAGPIAAGPMAH